MRLVSAVSLRAPVSAIPATPDNIRFGEAFLKPMKEKSWVVDEAKCVKQMKSSQLKTKVSINNVYLGFGFSVNCFLVKEVKIIVYG